MKLLGSILLTFTLLPATIWAQSTLMDSDAAGAAASTTEEEKMLPGFFDGFGVTLKHGFNVFHGDLADHNVFPKPGDFKETLKSGYKVGVHRYIKWGLGAQIAFEKGGLVGGRLPGKQSLHVNFREYHYGISVGAIYDLSKVLFPKSNADERRYYIEGHVGGTFIAYRSFSIWTVTGHPKDYYGYVEVETTEGLSQKTLLEKSDRRRTMAIPVGANFGYQLNHKTDLTFEITQVNTFTDELDTWVRDWSAKDKYTYIGIGVRYNFNRKKEDFHKKKPVPVDPTLMGNDGELGGPNDLNLDDSHIDTRVNIPSSKGRKKGKRDDLLDVRLKMFEIQLKLFEMQYLLND